MQAGSVRGDSMKVFDMQLLKGATVNRSVNGGDVGNL